MHPSVRSTRVFVLLAAGACVLDPPPELARSAQTLVPGVVYVSAGDYASHTDSDSANHGAAGSPQCDRHTDVDYWHNSEPGTDGCHVGWTQPGEVMRYPLGPLLSADGRYDIVLRLGSAFSGRRVRARLVYMGDKSTPVVAQADLVAQQQGWGTFADATLVSGLFLTRGTQHTLEVEHLTGELDFNGFELRPAQTGYRNVAQGKTIIASSSQGASYVASKANDGGFASYWESANHIWPQTLTVDLGAEEAGTSKHQVQVWLPLSWGARTQTFAVLGSSDGVNFSTVVSSASWLFDPANGNFVTVNLGNYFGYRYVRLSFAGNSGWPAAQAAELEVLRYTP